MSGNIFKPLIGFTKLRDPLLGFHSLDRICGTSPMLELIWLNPLMGYPLGSPTSRTHL